MQRGFKVTLFEQRNRLGGKARSMPVPHTATPGHHDLPGEHGFRFIPGFYKHLPNTMSRIPYANVHGLAGSVEDNLLNTRMFAYARDGEEDAVFPTQVPQSLRELMRFLRLMRTEDLGLTFSDILLFGRKLVILLTSCQSRRFGQWDQVAWWDFIEAADRSPVYQKYLGRGLTRSLVAMKAEVSSTRTIGYILIRLLLSIMRPEQSLDRLLNGPTNEVFIDPWVEMLLKMGVGIQLRTHIRRFNMPAGRISSVTLERDGKMFDVIADHYISAVPVEVFQKVITPEMVTAALSLTAMKTLRTDWMNGIQFYLDRDVPEVYGHVIYIDSPWSLTSISQHQFWGKGFPLDHYADGSVKGIISVCISDWEAPGVLYAKAARCCTRQEIMDETWAQMTHHLRQRAVNFNNTKVLYWHLDPDIVTDPPQTRNLEPLLVNTTHSWTARPDTTINGICNLNLASDYVRTYADLATMEGANEAARCAVNHVLQVFGSQAAPCEVWAFRDPWVFKPFCWLDAVMWRLGMRNVFDW